MIFNDLDLCYKISLIFVLSMLAIIVLNNLSKRTENFAAKKKSNKKEKKPELKKIVKYVRVRIADDASSTCIQVAQLAVYNEKNKNVALYRPVKYQNSWWDSRTQSPTDGTMSNRPFPQIYHDGWPCSGNASGNYMEIELAEKTHVSKVTYYNRSDCCWDRALHLVVELIDENRNVIAREKIYSQGAMLNLYFNY